MKGIFSAAFLFFTALSCHASGSFVCAVDLQTGFSFDAASGKWRASEFNAKDKYVVTRSKRSGYAWEVSDIGSKSASFLCDADFNDQGALKCGGLGDFLMNKNTLRFMKIYPVGYWTDAKGKDLTGMLKEGENTPSMSIGQCSPT